MTKNKELDEELKELAKIAEITLNEVEQNGWTIGVHTNCLALLKRLPKALRGSDE